MSRGAYLGGSSIINTGNSGGPSRPDPLPAPSPAASPRIGGAQIRLETTKKGKTTSSPRVTLLALRKVRRFCKEMADSAPYLSEEFAHLGPKLVEIYRRIDELTQTPFTREVSEEAGRLYLEARTIHHNCPQAHRQAKLGKKQEKRAARLLAQQNLPNRK